MEITAAVARVPGAPFDVETLHLDAPRPDEVLVKLVGVGLCHTDLGARDGVMPVSLPAVFGHEGAGIVQAVGVDVRSVKPGDRVVVSFRSCGQCHNCARDLPSYCSQTVSMNYVGTRMDGTRALRKSEERVSSNFFGQSSFASHCLTYERNLVPVGEEVNLEIAGPLACGILTGAGSIMNALACRAGSSLLITGCGTVGMGALLAAKAVGLGRIVVVELHESRRALALALGADHALDPAEGGFAKKAREILPAGFDHLLDSTGRPDVICEGLSALGALGTCGLVGVPPSLDSVLPVALMPLLGGGITIKGIVLGDANPHLLIPKLLRLHREGRFPYDRLIKRYSLSQINEAVDDHHAGRTIKAVLVP